MTLHELFTTDSTGLAEVSPSSIVRLHDGDRFDLRIASVRKTLNGADLRMLAYNGSIPGVLLGSRFAVGFPERYLRLSLASVLLVSGAKLL